METDETRELAAILRAARERQGMYRFQLAAKLNCSAHQIYRYERGAPMPADLLQQASRVLNAPELLLAHPVGQELAVRGMLKDGVVLRRAA